MNNRELAMRFDSGLESGDTFFTDLNGFQTIKRKRYTKLPLQANCYPIPSLAYIQDESSRLTLLTRQPLGGSSLKSGQMEIMMDRRLMQDDNRYSIEFSKFDFANQFFSQGSVPRCSG